MSNVEGTKDLLTYDLCRTVVVKIPYLKFVYKISGKVSDACMVTFTVIRL